MQKAETVSYWEHYPHVIATCKACLHVCFILSLSSPNPNSAYAHSDHWRATLCSNNLDISVYCVHLIQRPGLCPMLLLLLLPTSPSLSSANQISTSGPPVCRLRLIGLRYRLNSPTVQSWQTNLQHIRDENQSLCFLVVAGLSDMKWLNVWCIAVLGGSLVDSRCVCALFSARHPSCLSCFLSKSWLDSAFVWGSYTSVKRVRN